MLNRMNRGRAIKIAILATTALVATPAFAQATQEAPQQSTPAANGETQARTDAPRETSGLEDIVVTARRQSENLQAVPVAVSAISEERLQRLAIDNVEKIQTVAPGLIISRAGAQNPTIALRGISSSDRSVSFEQSVATIIDSVPVPGGRLLSLGLFDIGQIELLKGPQALYYGKNTTAGAISIRTADPVQEFQGRAKVGYEFNGQQPLAEGMINVPLTPELAVRLAGGVSRQYGALIVNRSTPSTYTETNVVTNQRASYFQPAGTRDLPGEYNAYVRGSAKYNSGPFIGTVKVGYNRNTTNSVLSTAVVGRNFETIQNPFPVEATAGNYILAEEGGQNYLHYDAFTAIGNFSYDAGAVSIDFNPSYINQKTQWLGDFDFSNAVVTHPGARENVRSTSMELRATSHLDGPLDFMVGGFYQDVFLRQRSFSEFGNVFNPNAAPFFQRLGFYKDGQQTTKTYSVFGQLSFDILPTLNLTGGARYTKEDKDALVDQSYVRPGAPLPLIVGKIAPSFSFNNVTPEATLSWKPTSDVNAYVSYKTGYKSGGYSLSALINAGTTAANNIFRPEKVRGFEAGLKTTLADRQLRLNLDAFTYRFTDNQVEFFDSAGLRFQTLNAGRTRSRGFGVETEFAPHGAPGLVLRAAGNYTDAKYVTFLNAPCAGGTGCGFQNLSGNRLARAPKFSATAGVDYAHDVSDAYKVTLSGNMRYSGRYKLDPLAADSFSQYFQNSFATLDATVGFGSSDDRWLVQLIGRNLTDKLYAVGVARQAVAPNYFVGLPRTVQLELVTRF